MKKATRANHIFTAQQKIAGNLKLQCCIYESYKLNKKKKRKFYSHNKTCLMAIAFRNDPKTKIEYF